MATLLDAIGILQATGFYSIVLPFILIFALTYAILEKTKLVGENKSIHVVIAAVFGFLFVGIAEASKFVAAFLPVISVFLIIMLFIILIFKFVGFGDEDVKGAFAQSRVWGPILLVIILFAFMTYGQLYPQGSLATRPELGDQFGIDPPSEGTAGLQNFLAQEQTRILFSPQIMGLIVMMIIFGLATYYITREPLKE